jgi:hypothetical protein
MPAIPKYRQLQNIEMINNWLRDFHVKVLIQPDLCALNVVALCGTKLGETSLDDMWESAAASIANDFYIQRLKLKGAM